MSLESAKEKLAKRFEGDIDERLKEIYVAPYGGLRPQVSEGERFFLLNKMVEIFTESDTRSLLILGDSGAGKTSLCLHLCKRLWEMYREDRAAPASSTSHHPKPLPIYIHLAQYKNQLREGLLEQVLLDIGMTLEEIGTLKTTQPLLLLLDGFDEVDIQESLYQTQRWGHPGYHICMVITCRPEALTHKNKQALFEASRGLGKAHHYETVYLQSFTDEQIRVYLERYLHQNAKDTISSSQLTSPMETPSSSGTPVFIPTSSSEVPRSFFLRVEDYLSWFERLPSLKELIKTPFLLTVAVRALPGIIVSLEISSSGSPSASETFSFIQQQHLTQSRLFKAFLNDWFFRQAQRVKAQGLLTMLSEKEIQGYMEAYAKNLASSLIGPGGQLNEKVLSEEECLRPEFIEPYQDEGLLEKYHHSDSEQNQSKHFFEEPHPGVKTQTKLQKSHLRAILSGCMLRSVGNQFCFIHKSIAEYLAAQELMDGLLGNYDHYIETLSGAQNLNRVLLTREPQILARLAEASLEDKRFEELLEAVILATKTQGGLEVAAANAISILNRAGANFCGRDFSQIQIPGAHLNESRCGGTHFEGANLRRVNFRRAYLAHAHFEGANLEGVEFGERAYWKMPGAVYSLVHYEPAPGVSEWFAGCSGGYAYRLNHKGQVLKSYRHKRYLLPDDNVVVMAVAVHASTSRLATGGNDENIWLWNLEGVALHKLTGHTGPVITLLFRPDGSLASGGADNTIRLWQENGTAVPILRGHTGYVWSLAVWPDGSLVSGSEDKTVRLWQGDGTAGLVLCGHEEPVRSVVILPDESLVSGGWDHTIRRWERNGAAGPVLQDTNSVNCLMVLPDGGLVCGIGRLRFYDFPICLWQGNGMMGPVLRGHRHPVMSLALSPDGTLASGSEDWTIRLWNIDEMASSVTRGGCINGTTRFAVPPDESVVLENNDGRICLWEVDGIPWSVFKEYESFVVRSDGSFAFGSHDGAIWLCQADGTVSRGLSMSAIKSWPRCLAVSYDGRFLSGDIDGLIHLWQEDGTVGQVLVGPENPLYLGIRHSVEALVFFPDGSFASTNRNNIRLWQEDGTPGSVLRGHRGSVKSLAVCSQGRLLSGSEDNTIRLWQGNRFKGVLWGHTGPVTSLVIRPNGSLISGSEDKTIRLWLLTERQLLQTFETGFSVKSLVVWKDQLYALGDSVMAFVIDDFHQFHVQWVGTSAPRLILAGAHLQGALNVSEENHALLNQQGATGSPQRVSRPYLPWCHLFKPITGTAHIDPQRTLVSTVGAGTSPHLIRDTAWVVSIARKEEGEFSVGSFFGTSGSEHAFLIIEGIQQRRCFIIRAELTYDAETEQVHIIMKPQSLAKLANLVARGVEAHQFLVDAFVGERLLRHIQADQQKVIRYSVFGDGGKHYPSLLPSAAIPSPSSSGSPVSVTSAPIPAPSAPAPASTVTETHSCLSWCRKQVMQIGQEMPTRWYNFAVTLPSDVTAPEGNPTSSSASSITLGARG